jgi:hypothetical protein
MGDNPGRETQFDVEGSGRERPEDSIEPGTTPDERHDPTHHSPGGADNELDSVDAANLVQDADGAVASRETRGRMTEDASGSEVAELPPEHN